MMMRHSIQCIHIFLSIILFLAIMTGRGETQEDQASLLLDLKKARAAYESASQKGKLTQEKFKQHMKLWSTALDYGAVAGAAAFTSRSRRENI